MSKVLLIRQEDYAPDAVERAVARAFEHFEREGALVSPGDRVLLKVNLVAGHPPERRVTTDPAVVRAVARWVLDRGGHPLIADSPGIDSFAGAARRAGLEAVARELGVPCEELSDPVPLPAAPGASFRKIEVGRQVLEADAVISLPKMKTHGQMLLSLGVKNLFGCVVGRAKAAWHYDVGLDRDRFAALLLDIYGGVAPALTILDGVIGMEGDGPTSGTPRPYGVLAAARDALTMDFWLCRMMGIPLEDFPLWRAAQKRGLPQAVLREEEVAGDLTASHRFGDVRLPASRSLRLLPRLPFLGRLMTSRPVHVPERCVGCGRCEAVCAAGALKHSNRTLSFDYSRCIRCYCCHEMCPVRAIEFRESPLVRLSRLLGL